MSLLKKLLLKAGKFFAIPVLAAVSVWATPAIAANSVYIAQVAAGSANGASCGNAYAVSYFNTSGNWSGSPTGTQIGPATHVYLCGTFTGTANTTMLTIQGSGSSGNPVLIDGTGATFTAPYWSTNGAIYCSGFSYITMDGGGTGLIENSANGTALANQHDSAGIIGGNPCGHIEIRNWIITNIYVHTSPSDSNAFGSDIAFEPGSDFISVHNNNVSQGNTGIYVGYSTLTNAQIYSNTADYNRWSIALLDGNSSSTASGVNIYGNALGPHYDIWADTGFALHLDGMILSAANTNSLFENSYIYNNYIQGDMGAGGLSNGTAYIFLAGNANTGLQGLYLFNNVLVQSVSGNVEAMFIIGSLTGGNPNNIYFVNNTIIGSGGGTEGIKFRYGVGSNMYLKNNIEQNVNFNYDFSTSSIANLAASNYNDYFSFLHFAQVNSFSSGVNYNTFASWLSFSNTSCGGGGCDLGSVTGNPNLNSSFVPQSGSAAVGLGANLTGLGITALDSDAAGIPRPVSGAWTSGAFGLVNAAPNPPTGASSSNGGSVGAHTVAITWNPPTGSGLTYYVFRGFSSGGEGSTPINSSGVGLNCTGPSGGCSYTDSTVLAGMNLYYFVESYNGSYSSPSNETNSQVPVVAPSGLIIISTN